MREGLGDSSFAKLTVLLLLKDRPEYTFRWITYANRSRFPFKVLIADGSAGSEAEEMLSNAEAFPNFVFEYVRYPWDQSPADFYRKKVNALTRVKTPYVVKATNDDFYLVDGLSNAVAFLDSHPDYSAARGKIFSFQLGRDRNSERYDSVYGRIERFRPFKGWAQSIEAASAMSRVEAQAGQYSTIWHDVQRTSHQKHIHKTVLDLQPQDLQMCEHITDFLTSAAGKLYRGSFPYMLLQESPRMSAGTQLLLQFPTREHWMKSPWWGADFGRLTAVVGEEIARRDQVSPSGASHHFEAVFISEFIGDLGQEERRAASRLAGAKRLVNNLIRRVASLVSLDRVARKLAGGFRAWSARRAIDSEGCGEIVRPIALFLASPEKVFRSYPGNLKDSESLASGQVSLRG